MGRLHLGILVVPALIVVAASQVQAGQTTQQPQTAEDVVVMQAGSGEELQGRLLELSAATLAILVDGRRVDMPMEDVLRIDTRHDPVWNGFTIGAVIAGGLVGLACASADGGRACVPATIVDAGLGGLIGAGIDALHKGRTPIYIKAGKTSSAVQIGIRW
jgi:hypothetical protein